MRSVLFAFAAVLGLGTDGALGDVRQDLLPQPAPSLFASVNYGVMAEIPPGLTYCPVGKDWIGSDHGTALYLVPPSTCDGMSDARSRTPVVSVFYYYNAADMDHGRGDRPPATDEELAREWCDHPSAMDGFNLLGHPALGCRTEDAGWIELALITLWDLKPQPPGEAPAQALVVTLRTTKGRFGADLPILRAVAAGVRLCAPPWAEGLMLPVCPQGHWW